MRPYCPLATFHFCWLKSSVNEVGRDAFEFAFMLLGTLALTVTLLLRFSLRLATLELLVFELRLANAMIITTSPTQIIKNAARPPRIHQTAFDFFRGGAAIGVGVHAGGGCAGGGGGGGG